MSKGTISNLKSKNIQFEVKGLEEYLKRIEQAGKSIDEAVAKAIAASTEPIQKDIDNWAGKHRESGAVSAGVIPLEVKRDGNTISAELGITGDNESWHAVFVEYGSPKNRPADPGIRLAFENNAAKVKKIQRDVLREAGVPVDG